MGSQRVRHDWVTFTFRYIQICVYVYWCVYMYIGLLQWFSGKDCLQCRSHRRCGFNPWVRKVSWRKAQQPTPVFLPGESPWTEEPGGLQSIGSQRVRHDWSNLAPSNMYMKDHFRMAFGLGKANTVDVVHIYNGMSLSHKKKNRIMLFAATWVN